MIDAMIQRVIQREGGFVNHPADRGGPTKWGITLATLENWRKKQLDADSVRAMAMDEAIAIYKNAYWHQPGYDVLQLPPLAAELLFDSAVHHGVSAATKFIQRAVKVKADGVIGPISRKAINTADHYSLVPLMLAERYEYFGGIITRNASQSVFALGWLRRLSEFTRQLKSI